MKEKSNLKWRMGVKQKQREVMMRSSFKTRIKICGKARPFLGEQGPDSLCSAVRLAEGAAEL